MSSSSRKIGHYSINFKALRSDNYFFDSMKFLDLLGYIKSLPAEGQIVKNNILNIAIILDSYELISLSGFQFVKIIFKSAKFNHSPEYMNTNDGTERDSDKELFEGEKELTHILCRLETHEALTILEERKVGVGFSNIMRYLNHYNNQHHITTSTKRNFLYFGTLIPDREFLVELDDMKKITAAEVVVSKKILGTTVLNMQNRVDEISDKVTVTLKADSKKSIGKFELKKAYKRAIEGDEDLYKIRIFGYDNDGVRKILDSDYIRKTDYVTVGLTEKGVVKSHSIFDKMLELMGIENE